MKKAVAVLFGLFTLANLWAFCLGEELDCDCFDAVEERDE